MDISIFRHFSNSFNGNQLLCVIRDTFKMKEGFLLERGFYPASKTTSGRCQTDMEIYIGPISVFRANMLKLGHRWQPLALERQRRRRVTALAQRCSDSGWRRSRTMLSLRRVTTLAQHCADDGWRLRRTMLSHRLVTTLAQHCSDEGWRRRRTTLSHRRVTTLAQHCSDDGWRRRRTTLSQRRANLSAWPKQFM